jgi:hypothetical protein
MAPPLTHSFPCRQDAGEALCRGHPIGTVFISWRAARCSRSRQRLFLHQGKEKSSTMATRIYIEHIEGLSDHAPILLTTGTPKPHNNHRYKFELGWLQREGFHDMVKNV